MNLRIFDDLESLSRAAERSIRQSGARTIALTGGSTPKRLYELLGEALPEDVTWVLVDERYVPMSDPQSNAALIERTLFRKGLPERWLRFKTELDGPCVRCLEPAGHGIDIDVREVERRLVGTKGHQARRFGVGQWPQKNCVDNTKDRCVQTNAQGQRNHRNHCKCGPLE